MIKCIFGNTLLSENKSNICSLLKSRKIVASTEQQAQLKNLCPDTTLSFGAADMFRTKALPESLGEPRNQNVKAASVADIGLLYATDEVGSAADMKLGHFRWRWIDLFKIPAFTRTSPNHIITLDGKVCARGQKKDALSIFSGLNKKFEYVSTNVQEFSDPENWKPTKAQNDTDQLSDKIFETLNVPLVETVEGLGEGGAKGSTLFFPRRIRIKFSKIYKNSKGDLLAHFALVYANADRLKAFSYDDASDPTSYPPSGMVVLRSGQLKYLVGEKSNNSYGETYSLVDAGDYDGDGRSEFLFYRQADGSGSGTSNDYYLLNNSFDFMDSKAGPYIRRDLYLHSKDQQLQSSRIGE